MITDRHLSINTIDKIYAERSKSELWGIVARFTSEKENHIIREIFINNQTMESVARERGIPFNRIRQIKEKGLRKLRSGGARRELLEKFDMVEAGENPDDYFKPVEPQRAAVYYFS